MAACLTLWLFTVFTICDQIVAYNDAHKEELYVKPLQSGHVYSYFQFTTAWNASYGESGSFSHYHLFPKALGEVLEDAGVEELHLSQTQGLWRWDKWGYPVQEAPPGAELWVWFHKNTLDVDKAWQNLINMLAGMFCSTLNFLDTSSTIAPRWSFMPEGVSSHGGFRGFLRYGALPREVVCTENLTPWKKLLPCASRSGLGSLFNALKLYDASYHSLGLHFRTVCKNGENKANANCVETAVELKQTLSVVYEPTVPTGKQDWSFKKMYGKMISNGCPLAESSQVYVDLSLNKTAEYFFTLNPEPHSVVTYKSPRGDRGKVAQYNVNEIAGFGRVMNVAAKYNKPIEYKEPNTPLLYAHQFQTGYGQEDGGVVCLIYNNDEEKSVPVVYTQALPWFTRLYLHTLQIDHFPAHMDLQIGSLGNTTKPKHIHYIPGRDHKQPYHLELVLSLPPNTVTRLTFQYERALLKWTEYPPDANHGFYVGSAVITTPLLPDMMIPTIPAGEGKIGSMFDKFGPQSVVRIHTEHMLVSLPTPDFSMPYNVICLACTVVAIAFGSIHNLTTRIFVIQDPKKKGFIGTFMDKIKQKIVSKFCKTDSKKEEKIKGESSSKEIQEDTVDS